MLLVSDEVDVDGSSILGGRVEMKVVGSDDENEVGDFMTGLSDEDTLSAELGIPDGECVGPYCGMSLGCIVGDFLGLKELGDSVGNLVGN